MGHSVSNHPMVETVLSQILIKKIKHLVHVVRKEDYPNISSLGKVLTEIWALKVLLKWAYLPIENLLQHLEFMAYG